MKKCFYCGHVHHPMPVYTHPKKGSLIHVCDLRIVWPGEEADENDVVKKYDDFTIVQTHCKDQAVADGYVYRHDLTPRR